MSWDYYFKQVRQLEYGEKIEVPKNKVGRIPANFKNSPLSLHLGAKKVYREEREKKSIQIREYEDKYILQLDQYNPQHHPVKHAVYDATFYTGTALAGAAILTAGGRS